MNNRVIGNLKNLNTAYVICKSYNGKTYFRTNWSRDSLNPASAEIYWNTESVEKELRSLNENRKKCPYYRDAASKHFVNLFEGKLNYNNQLIVENRAVALEQVKKDGIYSSGNNSEMRTIANRAVHTVVKSIVDQFEKEKAEIQKRLDEYRLLQEEIDKTDFEAMLKPYETQGDKVAEVLYGKKA